MVTGASAGPRAGESPTGTCHLSFEEAGAPAVALTAASLPRRRKYQASPGAAQSVPMPIRDSASHTPRGGAELAGGGAVHSVPLALTSNAQASTTTLGKP